MYLLVTRVNSNIHLAVSKSNKDQSFMESACESFLIKFPLIMLFISKVFNFYFWNIMFCFYVYLAYNIKQRLPEGDWILFRAISHQNTKNSFSYQRPIVSDQLVFLQVLASSKKIEKKRTEFVLNFVFLKYIFRLHKTIILSTFQSYCESDM